MGRYDSTKDYYSILGADADASQSDIERLYKRRAVQHHPDRGGDEEEMKTLNEAYRVLRDEAMRDAYDAERRQSESSDTIAQPPYSSPPAQVDVFTGQWIGAALFIGSGSVLMLLVRFQWIWFIWPLAILAFFLVGVGFLLAHAAVQRIGKEYSLSHRWLAVAREITFWVMVASFGYGIYLIIR